MEVGKRYAKMIFYFVMVLNIAITKIVKPEENYIFFILLFLGLAVYEFYKIREFRWNEYEAEQDRKAYEKVLKEREEKRKPAIDLGHPDIEFTGATMGVVRINEDSLNNDNNRIKEAIENYKSSSTETKKRYEEKKNNPSFSEEKIKTKNKDATEEPVKIVEEGQSKAEKENNVIIGEDGKATVKPNYKMIASEWVSENLGLLNKICNDAYAISGDADTYEAMIPAQFLPAEKATWVIIGKTLQAEDDISSFKILKDGLQITVA